MQSLLISQPDAVPRRNYKKKTAHGRAAVRGLTGLEIQEQEEARQAKQQRQETRQEERRQQVLRQEAQEDSQLSTISVAPARSPPPPPPAIPETPLSPVTPTSLGLPIRTPPTAQRPRLRRHSSLETSPTSLYELPTSTAPAKLGRSKRKRIHTARYKESKASGLIPESQEAHKGGGEM